MSLSNLVMTAGRSKQGGNANNLVDIITFIESEWGLGMKLFPVQRVILKAHYGLELDDNPYGFPLNVPIPLDHPHYSDDLIDLEPRSAEALLEVLDPSSIPVNSEIILEDHTGHVILLKEGIHWSKKGAVEDVVESIVDAINANILSAFECHAGFAYGSIELTSKGYSTEGNKARITLSKCNGFRVGMPPLEFDRDGYETHSHRFFGGEGGFYKNRIAISDWRRENNQVFTEAGYLAWLFDQGRCNVREIIPGHERREMVLSIGRRSGKTLITSCILAYETYKLLSKENPQMYYGSSQSNIIQLISVATDKDQAGLLYQEASGHFQKCFAAETEIITDEGVKPIGELAGQSATVLTREGAWVEAPVRSFGVQQLYKVVLRRQGVRKVVHATADHRWFTLDERKAYRGKGYQEFTTRELRPGKHRLQSTFGRSYKNRIHPSPFGVAHGFTFGDGVRTKGERDANFCSLFGEKDAAVLPYFSQCPQRQIGPDPEEVSDTYSTGHKRLRRGVAEVEIGALPNFFKDYPSIRENKAYLLGWLVGYFAADGSVSDGQVVINSASLENIEFFRDVCVLLGIGIYPIRSEERVSDITGQPHRMFKMGLMRHTLDESFFITPSHKEAFLKAGGEGVRRKVVCWTVDSVEPTERVEEVFCVTVEGSRSFVLEGNIATGNCDFFRAYAANATQTFATFQTPHDIDRYGSYADNNKARYSVKVTFRSCVAKGLRGGANILVALDEVAHFTDAGQSSADEVYQAVEPSTRTFSPKDPQNTTRPVGENEGRIIMISSPLGKQGLFYKQFQIGFTSGRAADNMLCIQAPTWEVNPTVPAGTFESSYLKDPRVFYTEFGAEFTDRTRGWLENEVDLRACIDPDLRPQKRSSPRAPHFMGVDVGLVGDGTAVAIGHLEEDGTIVLDYIDKIKAGEGDYAGQTRLDFDAISDWIFDLSKRFYIYKGMFDQHAGIPLEQSLAKKGLKQFEAVHHTRTLNSQLFENFKNMMYDRRLALYNWPLPETEGADLCEYLQELTELQAEVVSKYITLVEAPPVEGKHDDLSDALMRMVWMATNHKNKVIAFAGRQAANNGKGPSPGSLAKAARRRLAGGSDPKRQVPGGGRFRNPLGGNGRGR